MTRATTVLGYLAPVALMLLLVTTSVRVAANSASLYMWLFERHGVAASTGIDEAGLRSVAAQVRDYFNSGQESLRVVAPVRGVNTELFRADEVSHMRHVKVLMRRAFATQLLAAGFLAITGLVLVHRLRRGALPHVAAWLRRGALLTVGLVAGIGLVSLVAFDPLFTLFHRIAFPQGNWTFDPRTSYLVRVFPFGFWQDITIAIAGMTLLGSAVSLVAGRWLGRRFATPIRAAASRQADRR
ncbi:MAG: DUF1461 domain-containing protein [SAR202 cluster bacterium]|nr:DUF1461 domain-containing protein [SAR202 cluster bacterium]